jgi:hypothetical protein
MHLQLNDIWSLYQISQPLRQTYRIVMGFWPVK